jgi:hypothetical protein
MNIHPLNKIKLFGTIVSVLVVGLVVGIKDPGQARANTNDNIHGYLFSDMPDPANQTEVPGNVYGGQGLGYVSLNNVAPDPVLPGSYGVNFDSMTGKFQGYGWSEYGNYVDFAPTATTPSGLGTTSGPIRINTSCLMTAGPCSVLGWIRYSQVGMSSLGGWDGWVSMHGTAADGSTYGVMYDPVAGTFSGAGWGSDVVGWVDFSEAYVAPLNQLGMTCQDAQGNTYSWTPPANPPQQCSPTQTCYDSAGNPHTYSLGSPMPGICSTPTNTNPNNDVCSVAGIQTVSQMNFPGYPYGNPPVWYGLANGICQPDACKDNPSDQETYGFQAYVPFTGSNNNTYVIDSDGVCKKQADVIPCTDPANCPVVPIKPIYKEN